MKENLEAFRLIKNRKSVRAFTGENVSKGNLEKILDAGMSAPSAMNAQPWSFVVITERVVLNELEKGLPYAKMLKTASAAIIVCGMVEEANQAKEEYAVIDACCVSENILLAVESLGLGAVWTAVYPNLDRLNYIRETLNIPANVIPINVIPIGVPANNENPKDKWKPEKIHWEKW